MTDRDSAESTNNVEVFVQAPDVASAKPLLKKVRSRRHQACTLPSSDAAVFALL
jgi:hypothetical protein